MLCVHPGCDKSHRDPRGDCYNERVNASKLLVVSNRLPVSVSKKDGKLVYTVSSGGLATAMSSLDTSEGMTWIGWPGIASEDLTDDEKDDITRELASHDCYPVFLSRDHIKYFYEGYANDTLWPLFHYFQSYTKYSGMYWEAYTAVNMIYLHAVSKCADPTSNIWVHDYHLMLLPSLIRSQLPDTHIGFFLHIPFPSYEIFRLLPERKQLLRGLLGADLIGFHTYDYARHFTSSCLRLLGIENQHGAMIFDGRTVHVDAFPIGIDYQKFRRTLQEKTTKSEIASLKDSYPNQTILLSVDRLDYSKGIMERLEAFELFLTEHPEYHKKVKLMVVAVPSRTEVETYQQLREAIEKKVSRINGDFGDINWAPISYQFQNLPFDRIVALYSVADIALITPLRDGMNLVAKEYIAAKSRTPGVLILSEMTGAYEELPESLGVNPNDIRSIKNAIVTALTMPKSEQRHRLKIMQERIADYTVQRWGTDFIEQLSEVSKATDAERAKRLTIKRSSELEAAYRQAHQRLILLDYDGTLQPFTKSPSPQASRPSDELLALLVRIASQPRTTLCIISGRSKHALDSWFGETPIQLIAEHGAWVKQAGAWSQLDVSFDGTRAGVLDIMQRYASRTPGAIVESKDYAAVWHYRRVPTELAYARTSDLARELYKVINPETTGIHRGNKILEVKPKEVNKGYATREGAHNTSSRLYSLCR
jgi:trehalose 6-phosphate synthase/phosphatase